MVCPLRPVRIGKGNYQGRRKPTAVLFLSLCSPYMINIVSRAYLKRLVYGPKKVVDNLIKGLDLVGYPYVVNKRLDACRRLWIHDDLIAMKHIGELPAEVRVIVG